VEHGQEPGASVGADIYKRPFITIGLYRVFTDGAAGDYVHGRHDQAVGGKRWSALHRLVYVSAIAGVVHYYWLVQG